MGGTPVPEKQHTTLSALAVGDYVEGKGGQVWKVVRSAEKPDGRYIGLTRPGEKQIVKADERPITRLVYPKPTMEQAVDSVKEILGGQVLAESKGVSWFHPPHSAFEIPENEGLLRAHLLRFHGITEPELHHGDLLVVHHGAHSRPDVEHDHTP